MQRLLERCNRVLGDEKCTVTLYGGANALDSRTSSALNGRGLIATPAEFGGEDERHAKAPREERVRPRWGRGVSGVGRENVKRIKTTRCLLHKHSLTN